MKQKPFTWIVVLTAIITTGVSCHTVKVPAPKNLDKYWTLEPAPNALDTVGVVFAVDSKGVPTRIPGGTLKLHVSKGSIALAEQSKDKIVSFGATVNFLQLKYTDSTAHVAANDSNHVQAAFKVTDGTIGAPGDDDLRAAFDAKSKLIADNVKFLSLENQKLYIILETISSKKVNITFDRTSKGGADISVKFKSIFKANPAVSWSGNTKDDLVYDLGTPLTVFYHLRPIDVNVIGNKGTGEEKVVVSLGRNDNNQQELKH
ncbi:MAG: hypothetical protein ACXVJN_22465 [Mucilaginibacter sp.]